MNYASRITHHASRIIYYALFALLLGIALHFFCGYSHIDLSGNAWGADDAYISYRYARNLARGEGLVFNPGERVEGYSNFLYVLLISLFFRAGVGDAAIYFCSTLLNVGCVVAAFLIFVGYVRRRLGASQAGAAALLFALCPAVWVWATAGLETPLVFLLQIALWMAVEQAEGGGIWLAIPAALLTLTRADGFISPVAAVIYLLLRRKWRPALFCGAATALTAAAHFGWRFSYYGYWLPNTYYAKVSDTLARRLPFALVQLGLIAAYRGLLPCLAVFPLVLAREWRARRISFAILFVLTWLAYWLYIGGDVFYERFLLILIPLGIFKLLQITDKPAGRGAWVLWIAVLALQLTPLAADARFRYTPAKYDRWVMLGRRLGAAHAGRTLAVDVAGKLPFFSGLETIDMLGLNDLHIAHAPPDAQYQFRPGHNKFDADYVLARRPDLIAAWLLLGEDGNPLDLSWGLTREKYEPAGYRLRYLVNAAQRSDGQDIVDVQGMDEAAVRGWIERGYHYAVLELCSFRYTESRRGYPEIHRDFRKSQSSLLSLLGVGDIFDRIHRIHRMERA